MLELITTMYYFLSTQSLFNGLRDVFPSVIVGLIFTILIFDRIMVVT